MPMPMMEVLFAEENKREEANRDSLHVDAEKHVIGMAPFPHDSDALAPFGHRIH